MSNDARVDMIVPENGDPCTNAQAVLIGELTATFFRVAPGLGLTPKEAYVAAMAFPVIALRALDDMPNTDLPTTDAGWDDVEKEAERLSDQFASVQVVAMPEAEEPKH